MTKINLLISFVFFVLINLTKSQSEKQIKIKACAKVSKARIFADSTYFRNIIESLSQEGVDETEASNKIMTLILLNCYNKISLFTAEDINKKYKNFKTIPALENEYKELLELEKWEHLLMNNDRERLNEEMENLKDAFRDIKSEDLNFEDDENDSQQNKMEDADTVYVGNDKKVDMTVFGFNFAKLDSFTKNLVGLVLIVCIFAAIIWGLVYIKNMNKKEPKKQKNPKKNN